MQPAPKESYETPMKVGGSALTVASPAKEPMDKAITEKAGIRGLGFLALKNNKRVYVVPSSKNYVGSIQFKDAVADSGCATMLLKVHDEAMLDKIFQDFADSKMYWMMLKDSVGSSGVCKALVIKHVNERLQFRVTVGRDLFGEDHGCDVKIARFHLSSEHAKYICRTSSYLARFSQDDQSLLRLYSDRNVPVIPVSLVGNMISDQYAEVRYEGVRYFFDVSDTSTVNFENLRGLSDTIKGILDEETKKMMDLAEFDLTEFGGADEDLVYDL